MARPDESHLPAPFDSAEYARAVGDRVAELVERALEQAPQATRTDPDSIAEVITDLFVDKISDPGHSELAELVGPVWTAEHTRRVLRVSRAAMLDRRRTGSLLALKSTGDGFFYPVSQFEKREGKIRVKPDLRKFMMVLRERDPWTIAVLIHTPAPELGDSSPLDWVRNKGEAQPLLDYAAFLRTEYAR